MKPLDLVPFTKVEPFEFHKDIKSYKDFDFKYFECDDKTNWDLYSSEKEGLEIYTEAELIVSIACRKTLNYNGINIIGMDLESFLNMFHFKITDDIDKIYIPDEDAYQDVIEIDDIGLQLWCKDSIIVTVFCSPDTK